MSAEQIPDELQSVVRELAAEFQIACDTGDSEADWLDDYEVLQLRAPLHVAGRDLEVYLQRPLIEDLANLTLAERKRTLESLRALPGRALAADTAHWLLGEGGEARPLDGRPFI